MPWKISCDCGAHTEAVPPALCPGCGRLIRDPMDSRDVVDQMALAEAKRAREMVDAIGRTADGEW